VGGCCYAQVGYNSHSGYQTGYGGQQGYGGQPGYGHGSGGGTTTVMVSQRGGRKRLSQEGWCWVILLLLLCWPLCWLPFVMDQCYEHH